MQQEEFLQAVSQLKARGKSIRAIAAELGVNRGRVDRAFKKLALPGTEKLKEGPGGDVFVGRRLELQVLTTALADALSGRGRIVMLSGEPGIGKTRLAQEIGIVAADNYVHPLWGRCCEGQGAPSYWPWVQIVRDYVQGRDDEQLRSEMGACCVIVRQ